MAVQGGTAAGPSTAGDDGQQHEGASKYVARTTGRPWSASGATALLQRIGAYQLCAGGSPAPSGAARCPRRRQLCVRSARRKPRRPAAPAAPAAIAAPARPAVARCCGVSYTSVWQSLVDIAAARACRRFFRGNAVNCMRIVPMSAIQFATYEELKRRIGKGKHTLAPEERLGAGALAAAAIERR